MDSKTLVLIGTIVTIILGIIASIVAWFAGGQKLQGKEREAIRQMFNFEISCSNSRAKENKGRFRLILFQYSAFLSFFKEIFNSLIVFLIFLCSDDIPIPLTVELNIDYITERMCFCIKQVYSL